MHAHRLVLLITLGAALFGSTRADANPLPFPFHAVEGPFATLAEYCQRFTSVAGTCKLEAVQPPVPEPFGDFRAIQFARVRAHGHVDLDWLVLVLTTDKGLFVDDRLAQAYGWLFEHGDAGLVSVEKSGSGSGTPRLDVRLRGHTGAPAIPAAERAHMIRADGSYDEMTTCASESGVVRCLDPGVVVLD